MKRYRLRVGLAILPFLLLAGAVPAGASQPATGRGQPSFGLTFMVQEQPRLGETFKVLVLGSGRGRRGDRGEIRVRIPDGIELVEGDTVSELRRPAKGPGGFSNTWPIALRPTRVGKFAVGGWMRIYRGSPENWDETECVLDLDVRPDTVIHHWSRSTRHERVVDGQRFRYGWDHMVLIDGPEVDIEGSLGQREDPQAIEFPPAMCHGCGLAEPKVVRYVVTVGVNGTVTWIEPRPVTEPPEDPQLLAAAEQALRRWRFRPARLGNRTIANWAVVDVPVVPESK